MNKASGPLIQKLRQAASQTEPQQALHAVLSDFTQDATAAEKIFSDVTDDDVILYEDNNLSIWFCRFPPGKNVPAHNHHMAALIGVYQGTERNRIFERDSAGQLSHTKTVDVSAGDVFTIEPDMIHSVSCISPKPSEAVHVYLGPLSITQRELFNLETGDALEFTEEEYIRLAAISDKVE